MDLQALMQKLETINTTQTVAESVETKQVITESVATPARSSADPVFKSSIARNLAEEFGYELDERITINPDGTTSGGIAPAPAAKPDPNKSAEQDANTKAMQANRAAKDGTTVQGSGTTPPPGAAPATKPAAAPAPAGQAASPAAGGVANPYQGADAAKFAAMSPADQAWLTKGGGKPDINDQFILARAPNKGAVVAAPAPATAPAANTTSAATGVGNPGEEAAAMADREKRQKETNAQTAADTANTAQADAIKSGAQDDVTGVDAAVKAQADQAASAPLQLPPGAKPEAGMTVAGGDTPAAAKPKIMAKPDPAVMKIQQDLIAQGAKIKADGVMGPATQAAMKQFPGVAGAPAAGAKPDELAAVKKNAGMPAAAPAAASAPAKTFAQDTAARKAPVSAGAPNVDRSAMENIQTKDDQILAMIRNIRVG